MADDNDGYMMTRAYFVTRPGDGRQHSGRAVAIARRPPGYRPLQSQTHRRYHHLLHPYLVPELYRRILGPLEATAAGLHLELVTELAPHCLRPVHTRRIGGYSNEQYNFMIKNYFMILLLLIRCRYGMLYHRRRRLSSGVVGCRVYRLTCFLSILFFSSAASFDAIFRRP